MSQYQFTPSDWRESPEYQWNVGRHLTNQKNVLFELTGPERQVPPVAGRL